MLVLYGDYVFLEKNPRFLGDCEKAGALYLNVEIPVGGYTPRLAQPLTPTVQQRSVYVYCGDYVFLKRKPLWSEEV
jgi:hypothetical protein